MPAQWSQQNGHATAGIVKDKMTLAESQDARRGPESARDAKAERKKSPQAANGVVKAVEAANQPSARGCLIGLRTCLGSLLVGRGGEACLCRPGLWLPLGKTKIASFGVGSNPTSWVSRGSRGDGDAARGAS